MKYEYTTLFGVQCDKCPFLIMTWDEFVRRGLWLYYNRNNITYCLGCAGEVAGRDKNVENQFKYYYYHDWKYKIGNDLPGWNSRMTADETWQLWLTFNNGKMCFDCSGLLCWCMGLEGLHRFSSWDFGAMKPVTTPPKGFAGYALFKPGHVSMDVGYGYCIEIGQFNHTIEFNKISDRDFTTSSAVTTIDYTGSDAR